MEPPTISTKDKTKKIKYISIRFLWIVCNIFTYVHKFNSSSVMFFRFILLFINFFLSFIQIIVQSFLLGTPHIYIINMYVFYVYVCLYLILIYVYVYQDSDKNWKISLFHNVYIHTHINKIETKCDRDQSRW